MALNIRLCYEKTGRAKYISHLDLMRAFRRAFCVSELPLRYSDGFNPHIYLSIALPMPVGVESVCERLDFGLSETISCGTLPGLLNKALPDGLRVTGAYWGGRPFSQIDRAVYRASVETTVSPQDAEALYTTSAVVEKRTKKKGIAATDIVPMIKSFSCKEQKGGLCMKMALSAQNPSLNPAYIAKAFHLYLDSEAEFDFSRQSLLDSEGEPFDQNCNVFC